MSLEDALRQARGGQRARGGPYLQAVPYTRLPCEFVLTARPGSNGKIFRVRCRCQAQTRDVPSAAFWNYDYLGEVTSLAAGIALWREHTRAIDGVNSPRPGR